MLTNPIPPAPPSGTPSTPGFADRLEQLLLEEMLKHAGPRPAQGAFGGGTGEEQFATFLTREYAACLASALEFGLPEPGRPQR